MWLATTDAGGARMNTVAKVHKRLTQNLTKETDSAALAA